ncbi:polymorphic toxin type 37 domain-containing protein [Stenotrophomonas sp. C1657]|uniref:polymorphic toxin type 37 domain-containing protein n=1 Tax=Stenotrophomonas sp. C1657 TaxID=3077844 RepID=UPI00359F5CC6
MAGSPPPSTPRSWRRKTITSAPDSKPAHYSNRGTSGPQWVKSPNGRGSGWLDKSGDVWVPSGQGGGAHGGPHWDVQSPNGDYINVYPGGRRR